MEKRMNADDENDPVIDELNLLKIPVTRESYISLNWMGDYDPSQLLPAELEAELPESLQMNPEDNVLQMKKRIPKPKK